jgi:SAM-dependent methyltransferase
MSPDSDAAAYWEQRYGDAPIWSGDVNRSTADVAATLTPGTALDLGSGEGGDAVWLASRGWTVTAVDIATTALDRGRAAAEAAGVGDRITWRAADLAEWTPDDTFDLVTASFLHSTFAFPRRAVLRRAATAVAPGGHLLVVGHAALPPWSSHVEHAGRAEQEDGARLLGPDEQVADLALDPAAWTIVLAELRTRRTTGPDGQPTTIDDTVVLARRDR